MIEAAYQGLLGILEPQAMLLMVSGVLLSSVFAALPGVGVLLILTVVLPFSLSMSPYHAIAFLLGIGAVSNTANTFPSVLIAVPGSAGSQATILDGYPMARKGEAKRAFGAAFMASAVGGVLGAIVLLASLPILRPLVLSFGSPEFFVLVVWGLSAIGVLSGRAPIKGLLAAILGILIATVGVDEKTAIERFSLDTAYLWDGVNVILIGLGLFAVPELIDLAVRRSSIAETEDLGSGLLEGIKDVFRHWWMVVRCSAIGVWVGVLPGLGSSVADWFAYAHAVQTEKNSERFGTGDVRGVIAPESSNNAKEGGALIPTIAFGIPGSTSLAIMLAAFVSVGIHPGSRMLTDQLHLTLAMVWVLVISNLMATSLAMGFAGTFARLSLQPFYVIVPVTLVLCASASFAASYAHEDLYAFLVFSAVGYLMKLFDWPRPPVLVAAVLGFQMETYLWLSIARYDFAWLLRPSVLLLLALVVFTLMLPVIRKRREAKRGDAPAAPPDDPRLRAGNILYTLGFIALLAWGASVAQEWPLRSALIVYSLAGVGIPLALLQVTLDLLRIRKHLGGAAAETTPDGGSPDVLRRTGEVILWIAALVGGILLIGFHVTLPLFTAGYAFAYGARWRTALLLGVLAEGYLYLVFDELLHVLWPEPLLISSWS
ncbi:MAG: tripartite tricarboxylate transporter permease [Deltaproteobacteria bacterium]|nr:tripartite tricarboxylate transporter permease [Deltaproteobacteria bacterium]